MSATPSLLQGNRRTRSSFGKIQCSSVLSHHKSHPSNLVAALARLPLPLPLTAHETQVHKPVDGGGNHDSSSSPGQSKELVTQRRRDANVVSDVVDLVDALLACDGDEDAGNEQNEGCQAGEDEVDGVDAAAREEEEGADAGEHG
ncbi:hypothetical protein HG530_010406 [Fusarium avenaceum]|nr:hypothetical protein HG530_010406 [Fusarium avenaceum]